jgi:hypothetical protein
VLRTPGRGAERAPAKTTLAPVNSNAPRTPAHAVDPKGAPREAPATWGGGKAWSPAEPRLGRSAHKDAIRAGSPTPVDSLDVARRLTLRSARKAPRPGGRGAFSGAGAAGGFESD